MAILWFGGIDRFQVSTTPVTLPTYRANIPFPAWSGMRVRLNGNTAGYKVTQLANIREAAVKRNWLHIESTNSTRTANIQYFEMVFASTDIPEEFKQIDNVLCFGFRIRSNEVSNQYRYLSFERLTATQNLNTGIGGLTASTVWPLEEGLIHPLALSSSQEKYVEYRVRWRENDICLIKIFVNKDLVYTAELGWDERWAILAGSPRGSGHWSPSLSSSAAASRKGASFFNDFYMSLDKKGDKVTTGMMGPVTAISLPLEEPVVEGEWICSNPNKSIKDILATPLKDQSSTMTREYVATDPADRPAHFRFTPPLNEKLKIVGFQQGFIAQQPLAFSTSLQYMQTLDGESIDPSGWKTTINVALEPGYSHIRTPAISQQPDGKDLTPEFIGRLGLSLNSTKKLIEDDPPIEEEAPPEEEV